MLECCPWKRESVCERERESKQALVVLPDAFFAVVPGWRVAVPPGSLPDGDDTRVVQGGVASAASGGVRGSARRSLRGKRRGAGRSPAKKI